jgi:tetraacyldisaccharide 4'-kinase
MTERRPPIPAPLGLIAEPFYRAAVAWRNRAFDASRGVTRLSVPVFSVGNLSVGGSGKTPMVMRIVEWLRAAGHRPAIAMRGYRAVPGRMSDEEAEYRNRFLDVPIVAQPDRLAGLKPILDAGQADCVVLDDGFQHRYIARDLDIVLVDATRSPFEDRCLPAGWLREPVESLERAGIVVLTHAEAVTESEISNLKSQISNLISPTPVFTARHVWTSLRIAGAPDAPIEWLRGRPVIVACGIGNPAAFIAAVRSAGAIMPGAVERRDHHEWNRADIEEVRGRLGRSPEAWVVTTEKDWVKLNRLDLTGLPIARPVLSIDLGSEQELLRERVLTPHRTRSRPVS